MYRTNGIATANSVTDFRFGCPVGEVLISGSCYGSSPFIGNIRLVRHGFAETFSKWSCAIANYSDAAEEMDLTAICVEPSVSGQCGSCTAIGDAVLPTQTTAELVAGVNELSASCPPETQLLTGNCMIDTDVAEMARLTVFGNGYTGDAMPGNTWVCRWNNKDGIAGTATVNAVCLR
ncbi:MAG: hypothetical protein MJE77_17970 [Proteobacteria bacterium]|nr:hypothetical protein [Pseudomonadota bacterium]